MTNPILRHPRRSHERPTPRHAGPIIGPMLERTYATHVLDVALRVGALMSWSQAATADIAQTMQSIISAYGVGMVQIDVTQTTIIVSAPQDVEDAPLTMMWHVQNRTLDYTRLYETLKLAEHIAQKRPDPVWVLHQLDELDRKPHRYRPTVTTIALGVMGGAFSLRLGANAPVAILAVVVGIFISQTGSLLNRFGIPMLFRQVAAGLIAMGVVVAMYAFDWLPKGSNPSLIVAANIMTLLSGMALVSSVQDAITGFHLTATGRILEILMSTLGIFVGIGFALRIGALMHVNVSVTTNVTATWLGLPIQVVAGLLGSGAAAMVGYAGRIGTISAGIAGAFGTVIAFSLRKLDVGNVTSAFIAATIIGMIAVSISGRFHIPALAVAMSGIVPLVPGFTLYRGFVNLVDGHAVAGVQLLTVAAGTALALAAGVILGPLLIPRRFRQFSVTLPARHSHRLHVHVPVFAGIPGHGLFRDLDLGGHHHIRSGTGTGHATGRGRSSTTSSDRTDTGPADPTT